MVSAAGAIFLVCVALVCYTIVGYPVLLWAISHARPRPVPRRAARRSVSIIVPVRNGERWVAQKLRSILHLHYPPELIEILVVSDGSTDATDEIVRGFGPRGVRLMHIPASGKAAALNAGMERARGEILFFTDVRQDLDPDSLATMISCFAEPHVGVVSGELVIRDGATREEANVGLYWRYEKWIRRNLSRLDSVMGATGCIYCMRRELASPLPPDTLADDMHLPLEAFFQGYRVILAEAKAFDDATDLPTEFRRKVRTLAGVYQLIARRPALLAPANRMWGHFVSHKVLRLVLPYALLGMAISAFSLPGLWSGCALALQGGFYGAAALDALVPERWRLRRLTSAARTFVVLMAAALLAVSVFFFPNKFFWPVPTQAAARARSAGA